MSAQNIQQYIKTFVDTSSTHLMPYIAQGKYNNEFIRGRQNKYINPKRLTIEDRNDQSSIYTEKKVFNRLLPIYLYRYGLFTQNMPIPGMKPIRNTSKEVADSNRVNEFVNNFITDTNFKQDYQRAVKHADVFGLEWFKTGIDWTVGKDVCEIETTVGETKGVVKVKEGRPFAFPVPMHEIFVDTLYIETMDDVNELVHRRPFSIEHIKKRWGVDVTPENVTDTKLPTYPRYSNFGFTNAGDIQYAYVYEYYKKPDAMYPNGRYIIMAHDKIIWDKELPYENGKDGKRSIPFDFFNMQSVPHHMVGVTVYSQLIPIQETFNAVKNRYLEYMNHIAIGQMYVWEGSLVNKKTFTTKPGKLISLKRNAREPKYVQKDKLSNEFINYLRTLEDDMLVTAGLSQMAATGQTKSNVRTDGVVDKLSESDENKLINALDNISQCLTRVFKKLIYLEKQRQKYLHESLKLANVDSYTFRYDLTDVDPELITIVNREFLMQSDQAVEKKLQQVMSLGMYNVDSSMSFSSKLEMLNSLKATFLQDTLDPMERSTHDLVDEENSTLFNKHEVPNAESFHVHAQHIVEHNLFRISPEVRKLKDDNPEAYKALQEAIDMHIKQHEDFESKKKQANVYQNAKATQSTTPSNRGQGFKRTA